MYKRSICLWAISIALYAGTTDVERTDMTLSSAEQELIIKEHITPFLQKQFAPSSMTPINSQEWKDLELDLVAKKLNRTQSLSGRETFKALLQPQSNITVLDHRRELIEELRANKILAESLSKEVATFATSEEALLRYFNKTHPACLSLKELSTSFLGKKAAPWFEAARNRLQHLMPAILLICNTLFLKGQGLNQPSTDTWRETSIKDKTLQTLAFTPFVAAGMATADFFTGAFSTPIKAINKKVVALQKQLIESAAAIKAMKAVYHLIQHHNVFKHHEAYKTLASFFDPTALHYTPQLDGLYALLTTATFSGEPSAWASHHHRIYQAGQAISDALPYLVQVMAAVGEIDAYIGIARLHEESAHQKRHFSLPTFIASAEPVLSYTGLWEAQLDPAIATPNDIALGGDTPYQHILLSGPHGSGKTTIMRSIALAIVLAQSLLLVPADTATMTVFDAIKTYVNVSDVIEEGKSSFVAEQERLIKLAHFITTLAPSKKCLFLVDEPAAKTLEDVAQTVIEDFIKDIIDSKNLILLLSTHNEKATRSILEAYPRVGIYHPEVLEPSLHTFVPTYKIIQGPAEWWYQSKETRDRFLAWLKQQRRKKMLESLNNQE